MIKKTIFTEAKMSTLSVAGIYITHKMDEIFTIAAGAAEAVRPGYVRTDMVVQVFAERGPLMGMTPEAYEKTLTDSVPMKRMASSEEIADLMIFLSSDAAGYITGVTITSAGGKTLI